MGQLLQSHSQQSSRLSPEAPQSVSGVVNADGSITLNWTPTTASSAYVIHYGAKNVDTPAQMTLMGYSEGTEWTLKVADVPDWSAGDRLTFAVQSYYHRGVGATDIEKAQYLNSSSFGSSVWSQLVTLTHP